MYPPSLHLLFFSVCLCFYLSLSSHLFVCGAASPPHCCLSFLLVGHIHSHLLFSSGLHHYWLQNKGRKTPFVFWTMSVMWEEREGGRQQGEEGLLKSQFKIQVKFIGHKGRCLGAFTYIFARFVSSYRGDVNLESDRQIHSYERIYTTLIHFIS